MRVMQSKILPALLILIAAVAYSVFWSSAADAGDYLNSAHGDGTNGVDRSGATGFPTDYPEGFCDHCHEQHASIGGAEPEPTAGTVPSKFELFYYPSSPSQTDNFCFQCHTNSGSYQSGGLINYNYSYRAGNDTSLNCPNNILTAFSFIDETGTPVLNCTSTTGSSHKLTDISTYITGKWGYTASSNPCVACHDPHRAQEDPYSSGSRTSVSLPSGHADTSTWALWGNDASEKMNNYTAAYQAPYRKGLVTYEPDGSATQNGSNLTDYVTFCIDCHTAVDATIYSTALGRNLKTIDWSATGEKHGKLAADNTISMDAPYGAALGKVTACTDCHEPHGSTNVTLLREEVNGVTLAGNINAAIPPLPVCAVPYVDVNNSMEYLCNSCHQDDFQLNGACAPNKYYLIHHDPAASVDAPYDPLAAACVTCHNASDAVNNCNSVSSAINCACCHYHGSAVNNATFAPAIRGTF